MSLPYNDDSKNDVSNIIYNYDWSKTSLGPIESWEPAVKNALNLCLQSAIPMSLYLGPDWLYLYNNASIPIIKIKHPHAMGKPDRMFDSIFENIRRTGKGLIKNDQLIESLRDGYLEDVYINCSFSPIFKPDGTICGILKIYQEITQNVLNTRRLKTIDEFGRRISEIKSLENACNIMMNVLSDNNKDIPYALIYFIEHKLNTGSKSQIARLIATTFDEVGKEGRLFPDCFPETPEIIDLTTKDANQNYDTYIELKRGTATYSFLKCDSWPISLVIKEGKNIKVFLKDEPQAVLLLTKVPLSGGQILPVILICGLNQRHAPDENYMEFLQLVTNKLGTYLHYGNSIEEEKKRSKILADLNYQKDMFFQGISHEFKTQLTLMLSPLDEVINICPKEAPIMSLLQIIRRNTHRLLKLINILLQFSNIESDQSNVRYRETNIAEFTRELVSDFEKMAKTLGLGYIIDIPEEFNQAVSDNVYLDHDMFETIVFNLCSNALKHTWNGHVKIRLYIDYRDEKKMIVLEVIDTGVGIPETALPNIFQRFYRVESQSSRSHEGTGIGLAIVKELITLHGGDITVTSIVNKGTTFKCWFPIGCKHLPADKIHFNDIENPIIHGQESYTNKQLYLEESSQWLKNSTSETKEVMDQLSINNWEADKILTKEIMINSFTSMDDPVGKKCQVLLVDDNIDMRDYLTDLLKEFDIYRACDGQDALKVLKKLKKLPDLILSDVMMPNMNGYELLDELRSNKKTQFIPIILLSAKADVESKLKADDYLIKPFSARELITRIRSNIKLSFLRRKIIFEQCKQEETKQLLFSISNKILSGLSMKETLQYIVKEIHHRLPKIRLNNDFWGWIIAYRPPNSIWFDFEIELLEQVSNQISLAITHAELLEENIVKKIQIKAAEAANFAKSQILANTSHELRTPLGAIVGILSSFESSNLTSEQRDMIDILSHSSEIVLSIVKDILDAAKLEAHKITLASRTFDLYELMDNTIEIFEKEAGDKKIEIIVNYDMDALPKYVKSDPDRIKFEKGEIGLKILIQSQKIIDEIDEIKESTTYNQKANLLIELYDTGIG
ncbi:11679_t:CDS:10 [Scutellospora calospora]|uniref:11679_t:CDS:1 n=1 Tax=Scutellospora calospora TaxID=85575 RepID=A0ACA9JV02_9GLOM|nr:11679_t:CDS:10 [Scutellospora calospora]